MLKFYILISSDPGRLWRHFSPDYSALPKHQTEVIINTTSKQEERDLVQFCTDFDISYTVTKSNGTPARGKNSVLEIFSKSSHDYCVQIDGDDYLTPHGVELYQQIAESGSAPDAICLKNQVSLTCSKNISDKNLQVSNFFTYTDEDSNYEELREEMAKDGLSEEKIQEFISYKKEFHTYCDKYVEADETHSRVVFFSKKAAQYHFREDIMIGEDTLQYYELKNAHMRGDIQMVCNDEAPVTYVYRQDSGGVVYTHTDGFQDWTWMKDFTTEVQKLSEEGKLWDKDLPLLEIEYNNPPCMKDYALAGPVGYVKDDHVVWLPANASISCVKRLWKDHNTPIEK